MVAAAVLPAPHDVPTTLNYYTPIGDDSEPPFTYAIDPPPGVPTSNYGQDPHPTIIHDVRGKEDTVSLDKTGFQFVKHVSEEKDFLDEDRIKSVYYKEVEALLKKETGAKRVFIFGHAIRRNYANDDPTKTGANQYRGPIENVHVDQTFEASVERVHRHLKDEAERLLKSRVRLINVWRPIGHPVAHHPLAVADWRTLDVDHDLVPIRYIYPDRVGATYRVKYNPQLRWNYMSEQTPDEVTLIKCFDSDTDKARLAPHTAFLDASSPKSAPPRQSIEVRTLVFDSE
ncbi:methyltransferase [Schizopora paradoxa]|uniref:Methyltransferase n=1 Tax=Schizopora paradoxa TaxID=27342 RepID=A0A0H2R934_9AGAM|nr:methyltransferase [Schizopora paradoxa]